MHYSALVLPVLGASPAGGGRSSSAGGQVAETFNRDIRPAETLARMMPDLRPLIVNMPLAAAFDRHERVATRWKRAYMLAGIVALIASLTGAVVLGAQVILLGAARTIEAVTVIGLLAAIAGVAATLFILLATPNRVWLEARFQAEWLRCFKFRLFLRLADPAAAADLAAAIAAATTRGMTLFEVEMAGGVAVLDMFDPASVLAREPPPGATPIAPERLAEAKRLYHDLRIRVQLQHFAARMQERDAEIRPARSLGDMLFAAALALTVFQLGVESWQLLAPATAWVPSRPAGAWLAFASWTLFAASATQLIYERGRGLVADRARYEHFHRRIERAAAGLDRADSAAFLAIVATIEDLCLKELRDFCRDMQRTSFIG